jgi:hypothetical protein
MAMSRRLTGSSPGVIARSVDLVVGVVRKHVVEHGHAFVPRFVLATLL